MFYIVNKSFKRLSQFVPNDVKPKLLFRKRDWYIYPTENEAQLHLAYIQKHKVGNNLLITSEF